MKMKKHVCRWKPWLGFAAAGTMIAILALACLRGTGQTAAALKASLISTNQIQLTVTNGVPGQSYEIQRRPLLDPLYPWETYLVGTNSQTNFVADMGID